MDMRHDEDDPSAQTADPFAKDMFADMWDDCSDSDLRLVQDRASFLDDCEAKGFAECVPVTEDALNDDFAADRGIEPGGMMWQLTDAGRARHRACRAVARA